MLVHKWGTLIFENIDSVEDPGSGAFLTLDPGSWIGFSRSQNTNPYFWLMTNFWVKSTKILSVLAKKIFTCSKKIIYNFIIFVATKNGISPSSFGAVVGSGIFDG